MEDNTLTQAADAKATHRLHSTMGCQLLPSTAGIYVNCVLSGSLFIHQGLRMHNSIWDALRFATGTKLCEFTATGNLVNHLEHGWVGDEMKCFSVVDIKVALEQFILHLTSQAAFVLAARIWGDLRDFDDVEEIMAYLERITGLCPPI